MEAVASARDEVADILARGEITAEDVADLRRSVFKDGVVSWSEAREVLALHQGCASHAREWNAFYVDSLTDFLVWSVEPKKYVTEEKARFIIGEILRDGHVDSESELELLVNVIYWSASCPEPLVELALQAVQQSVQEPRRAAYGAERRPRVIDDADVALVRRVIYAGASEGGYTVTQREAEILIELNTLTDEAANSPEWQDLFVKGIANYLMFPKGAPHVPSAEEYVRRETWLRERRGVGELLQEIGSAFGRTTRDPRELWREADPLGSRREAEQQALQERRTREEMARHEVTTGEAHWLIEHLGPPETLGQNAKALLRFIRDEGKSVCSTLKSYISAAGV